jgi:hypothetical protein
VTVEIRETDQPGTFEAKCCGTWLVVPPPPGESEPCGGCGKVTAQTLVCAYSAAHNMASVPAVTVIDCGPVGMIPACQKCADFYARMSTTPKETS